MSATIITMADFEASKTQAAQAARFVRRPVSVLVHWSESGQWEEGQTLPYADFEAQALAVALGYVGGGYQKTSVTVTFDDGDTYQARLDLAASDTHGFTDHCLAMLAFAETEKGRQYYEADGWQSLLEFVKGIDFGPDAAATVAANRAAGEAAEKAEQDRLEAEKQAAQQAAELAYQAEIERMKTAPEFAHLTQLGRHAGGAEITKNIRAHLKHVFGKDFKGCKFSVRLSRGGWSTSVYVSWTDGPTREAVAAQVNRFKGGCFNAMSDMYEHDSSPFTDLFGSASYLSISRDLSDELRALAGSLVTDEDERPGFYSPLTEASERISITAAGPLLDGKPWDMSGEPAEAEELAPVVETSPEQAAPVEQAAELAPVAEVAPILEQVAEVVEAQPAPAQVKPKFTAQRVGGLWSVSIEQGEDRQQFDGIEAASLAEACRIAWALLTQTTPPDDDPSGQPLPVEPVAEQAAPVEQGAEAPTLTRADLLGDYAARIEEKRERLNGRAVKAIRASDARYQRSMAITSAWYPGQPILVGHHSERRHRRDLARSDANMRQSVELSRKAERLGERAEAVGTGGIASDNPEALAMLRAKLDKREARQQRMKDANKATPGTFPAWELRNNNAEIRRLRQRIEQIEQLHQAAPIERAGDGWQMREEDGRILIEFNGKPAAELRQMCKCAGFVWAPSRCAWVRKISPVAVAAAERLARDLPV